eukprot:TRINITY_DN11908_c0_g1_i1.p1 TRINITY_DN11908_c0_g1~~TRINITY_DN11908_c0_g1_i1.p1  ORF type:complete len:464 (+),score=92.05 TRINITY_DN11908_c0_g1_i1:77-1468(+)
MSMVRNVSVQPVQMQQTRASPLFSPSTTAQVAPSSVSIQQQQGYPAGASTTHRAAPPPQLSAELLSASSSGGAATCGSGAQMGSRSQRANSPKAMDMVHATARAAPPASGVVRFSSGGQQPLSPPRAMPPSRAAGQNEVADGVCLHHDCTTCMDMRRRGFVLCRLPCGHTVRAQIVDSVPETFSGGIVAAVGTRSESPSLLAAQQRDRDTGGSTGGQHRGIMRQVSIVKSPAPSVGIPGPQAGGNIPPAPLSPPRGLAPPSSPQQTLGTMFRRATSSMTSFNIPRGEGTAPGVPEQAPPQQMTARGSSGGGDRGSTRAPAEGQNVSRGWQSGLRSATNEDGRIDNRRSDGSTTQAEVVTDSRGDVLHKMCNVILLSSQSGDKEQQLKVRGQIIGTYWDERDIGPPLDSPAEVQVMVTYVDASERHVPLMFPTKYAANFGETESPDGNIIKWKAGLCKVGKKFT